MEVMEQEKLSNQKETLAFLCSKYPKCFFLEGAVKPLKIGIFQDLAKELEDENVVSKRMLRLSLRHYTSGWRYLSAIKTGVARIDLSGGEGEAVAEQHAQHAAEQLKESKQKAAKDREEKAKGLKNKASSGTRPANTDSNPKSAAQKHKGYSGSRADHKTNAPAGAPHTQANKSSKRSTSKSDQGGDKPNKVIVQHVVLDETEVVVGNQVLVKLGKEPMPVTIIDISKDGISVQLKSGMTVKVKQEQLFGSQKVANK
jgi:ProP effector